MTITVTILMTPAAYHRVVSQGEDTEEFYLLASRLVRASMFPLAPGLCADFYVATAIVVRDQATLGTIVGTLLPAGTAPVIDFSKEQAIVALGGAAQVTIEVAGVDLLEAGEIEVAVHTVLAGSATSPFQVVAVPLTFGPAQVTVVDATPHP